MERTIITISRQYCSGGREVGAKLAKLLDIPFYDKDLISLAVKKSGFGEQIFENADRQATGSLLYSLSMGMYGAAGQIDGVSGLPLSDKVFLIQFEVIKEIAEKGSCVIVGRCADYVLREDPDAVNVFLYADLEDRIRRAVNDHGVEFEKANSTLQKTDKRRAAYYEYYTGAKWGRAENFDLALNVSSVGVDGAAELIRQFAEGVKRRRAETRV